VLLFNWPVRSNSRRVIARSDRSEEGSFSVLLYFYTPPKPLISKLFNHNISPGLFLSRDESRPSLPPPLSSSSSSSSPSSSTSSLSSPPLAFLFLPSLPLILTHRHEHYDLEKDFKRRVARSCRLTTRRTLRCAKSCRTYFSTLRKSHPPLADIRRRALIFLSLSLFHSLSLSPANVIIFWALSITFFLTLRTHPDSHCHSPVFFSSLSLSFSLFLSLCPWICSFVIVFMLKLPLWVTLSTYILYLTRSLRQPPSVLSFDYQFSFAHAIVYT